MFFFLATCISLLLPSWALSETRLLSMSRILSLIRPKISLKKTTLSASSVLEEEAEDETGEKENRGMSVLDLPELALDSILERLPPAELRSMAGVSTSLRDRCLSDHLWERHMSQKWGKLMGPAALRERHWYIATDAKERFGDSAAVSAVADCRGPWKILSRLLSWSWPVSWFLLRATHGSSEDGRPSRRCLAPACSAASWYIALETGKFSFPAQVYNRENGHVGFVLSCYDADLSYDPHTDSFMARYPPHGRRAIAVENGVPWDRLRAPPMDTSPHDLHISDCLSDLQPGDHIEIQWRRNKEFPYGWWYGVVGHLESCDGSENFCRCHDCDSVVLEFNQYTLGSRWRQTTINRKEHREEGNEDDGFYGGIRKLQSSEEISTWKQLWPTGDLQ